MTEQLAEILINFFGEKLGENSEELIIFIISMLPVLELRGGLIASSPLLLDVEPWAAFIICFIGNMVPIPFILLFIRKIFAFLKKFKFTRKIVEKLEASSKKKSDKFKKGLLWGLFTFVAIPLPGTGGWTGALIAAMLNMRLKHSLPVIGAGVFCAGIIMLILSHFFPALFGFTFG